jgi:hypothetical protein
MPALTKKLNLANEYTVIQFADNVSNGVTSPVFVKILKRSLALMGSVKKLKEVSGTYKSATGIEHKYHRDASDIVWRTVKGTKDGTNYEHVSVVNPPISGNSVVLELYKTKSVKTQGVGKTQKELVNTKIGFRVPASVNNAQIGGWIADNFGAKSSTIKEWTHNKARVWIGATPPDPKKQNSLKDPVRIYVPMGSIEASKFTPGGKTSKVGATSTLAVAVMKPSALTAFGFVPKEGSSAKEIQDGTKLSGTAGKSDGAKATKYNVLAKQEAFGQIWTEASTVNTMTKTPISKPGTGITVKCRFTKRVNVGNIAKKRAAVQSNTSYVSFQCASGTPVGLIIEAVAKFPIRPRAIQIATGGSTKFGVSYAIPQKNGATKA